MVDVAVVVVVAVEVLPGVEDILLNPPKLKPGIDVPPVVLVTREANGVAEVVAIVVVGSAVVGFEREREKGLPVLVVVFVVPRAKGDPWVPPISWEVCVVGATVAVAVVPTAVTEAAWGVPKVKLLGAPNVMPDDAGVVDPVAACVDAALFPRLKEKPLGADVVEAVVAAGDDNGLDREKPKDGWGAVALVAAIVPKPPNWKLVVAGDAPAAGATAVVAGDAAGKPKEKFGLVFAVVTEAGVAEAEVVCAAPKLPKEKAGFEVAVPNVKPDIASIVGTFNYPGRPQ